MTAINELLLNGISYDFINKGGSGLTDTQKELIITIMRNALYSTDQSDNIDELEEAFASTVVSVSAVLDLDGNTIYTDDTLATLKQYLTVRATYVDGSTQLVTGYTLTGTLTVGTSIIQISYRDVSTNVSVPVSQAVTRYTVTNNLTGVVNSNTDTSIAEGNTYTGVLHAQTSGYAPSDVIITVGGTDVTATAYNITTHTITVQNVQGNIVITANEAEDLYAPAFELTSPLVVGDTTDPRINDTTNNRINTGITIKDNESWTLCIDFTSKLGANRPTVEVLTNETRTKLYFGVPYWYLIWHNDATVKIIDSDGSDHFSGLNMVFVLTHEANSTTANCYGSQETTMTNSHALDNDGQIKIGATYDAGTINRCAIYKRILSSSEITAWIGG